jgi:DNA-binding MarR family transcriptional regulator
MEIQKILGYLLNTSARFIKRRMDIELEKYDITTSQWAVLKLLNSKKELSQAQIADELMGDRATLGTVIYRLIEKGYIIKNLDLIDRRSYVVSLSEKAQLIIQDMENMVEKVTHEALEGLGETEVEKLYCFLNRIINNLNRGE